MNLEVDMPEMVFVKKDPYDRMAAAWRILREDMHRCIDRKYDESNNAINAYISKADIIRCSEEMLSNGLYNGSKVVLTIIE